MQQQRRPQQQHKQQQLVWGLMVNLCLTTLQSVAGACYDVLYFTVLCCVVTCCVVYRALLCCVVLGRCCALAYVALLVYTCALQLLVLTVTFPGTSKEIDAAEADK